MVQNAFRKLNRHSAKLVASQVHEIRTRYATGRISQGELAREYRVTIVQIGRIVRNEVWQDLPDTPPSELDLLESAERLMAIQVATQREKEQAGNKMIDELTKQGAEDGIPRNPLDE